jgi:hypothetical protein
MEGVSLRLEDVLEGVSRPSVRYLHIVNVSLLVDIHLSC